SRRGKSELKPTTQESEGQGKKETCWKVSVLSEGEWSSDARLVGARTSSIPLDNLLVVDKASRQLDIVVAAVSVETLRATRAHRVTQYPTATLVARMELGTMGASAVLPMRLNTDVLSDL